MGSFAANNKKTVYIPEQGGIDTLTVRSVFDYLGVDYKTFDLPSKQPELSKIGTETSKGSLGLPTSTRTRRFSHSHRVLWR